MVGPAARLTERVHVRTPEEECLDVHLLDVEFPGDDFPMHPLMAGVETAGMTAHRDPAGLFLQLRASPRLPPRNRGGDIHPGQPSRLPATPRIVRRPLWWRPHK